MYINAIILPRQALDKQWESTQKQAGVFSGKPPKDLQLGAVTLQNLLSIRGDGAGPAGLPTEPAKDITVRGVGFRDAGYTYMSPHGNPGGGDWGLQSPQYDESGAVYLSGTEDVLFDSCTFKYLDGNAVFISGYNRTELRSTLV